MSGATTYAVTLTNGCLEEVVADDCETDGGHLVLTIAGKVVAMFCYWSHFIVREVPQ